MAVDGKRDIERKRKQQRINELGNLLDIATENVTLTKAQRSAVTEWQGRMSFRMNENFEQAVDNELDIKLECMENLFNALKALAPKVEHLEVKK